MLPLTSLSVMVTVAVLAAALSVAPLGLDRRTVKNSVPSMRVSSTMGMSMVCGREGARPRASYKGHTLLRGRW